MFYFFCKTIIFYAENGRNSFITLRKIPGSLLPAEQGILLPAFLRRKQTKRQQAHLSAPDLFDFCLFARRVMNCDVFAIDDSGYLKFENGGGTSTLIAYTVLSAFRHT